MKQNINNLKKQIIYRCSYTGTKETDLFFKKKILNKINHLDFEDLENLSILFESISDYEIILILTGKLKPLNQYKKLFNKLLNG